MSQKLSPSPRRVYFSATSGFELEPKPPKSWDRGMCVALSVLHDGCPHTLRLENWEEKVEINEPPLPWKLVLSTDCVST